MLNIIVCVKCVPDPKEICKIRIDSESKTLLRCDVHMVINPLDRQALEAGLNLKRTKGANVTVLSMGPPPAENILKECLALGADRGILLSDPAFGGADAFATSYTLAKGIEKNGPFDLVLCGMASSDGATEWVGPQVATMLNVPVVTMVREIQAVGERNWLLKADWEEGYRLVAVQLPALLTVTRSLNQPPTLSFSGIIKSRKKSITVWTLGDLSISPKNVGATGSPTVVSRLSTVQNRRSVQMILGTAEEKANTLVDILAGTAAIG
jgi:electron transfer flavoprotein beta subunit